MFVYEETFSENFSRGLSKQLDREHFAVNGRHKTFEHKKLFGTTRFSVQSKINSIQLI
jgi:hypothetical protein